MLASFSGKGGVRINRTCKLLLLLSLRSFGKAAEYLLELFMVYIDITEVESVLD